MEYGVQFPLCPDLGRGDCAWFVRAYQGSIGTPWFNVALGLVCLATGGVYVCRGVRDSMNTKRNK